MKRFLFIFTLFFFCNLHAQDLKLQKGDFEVTGSGTFNQAKLAGDLRFGAFIMDYLQLGIDLGYQDTDILNRFSLGTYVYWMFETQTYFLPYVGSGISLSSLEGDSGFSDSGLDFSLFFGLKYYLADNVSLNTEFKGAFSSAETFIKDNEASSSDYGITIGLSYYW